jgi:hypothetical protein
MGIAACFGVDLAAGRTQGNRDLGSAQVDPGVELVRFCHQSGLATSQYITDHRSVKMAQSRAAIQTLRGSPEGLEGSEGNRWGKTGKLQTALAFARR